MELESGLGHLRTPLVSYCVCFFETRASCSDCIAGAQSIEYSASVLIHLSGEGKGKKRIENLARPERHLTATILKNKYGLTDIVPLTFNAPGACFTEK